MAQIITIHSFRGGTGKSNTTANVAGILASRGHRVGVVDTDIQSPGIHALFGVDQDQIEHSLNDYLWGKCAVEQTAVDVTKSLGTGVPGSVYLIPSSLRVGDISRALREGYDVGVLHEGLYSLVNALDLDHLMIDTHPGLNEETLLSMGISHAVAIIMRPDHQDYAGTGVTVQVARRLRVPRLVIAVNKVPRTLDLGEVKRRVEETYSCKVAAVLPHSDELMALASQGVFSLLFPDHPMTAYFNQLTDNLTA